MTTTATSMKIPVIISRLRVRNRNSAVGTIRVGDLVKLYEIARRDPFSQTGYQRDPSPSRVNNLINGLKKRRVDLPTAILLNLRAFSSEKHLKKVDENYTLLNLQDDILHVVDGQHRVVALERLYKEAPEQWADFTVPFVCMLGADELEEMEEFYVVNSNAKSVSTSLALDILKQRAENSPAVMDELHESGKGWLPAAQTLVQELANTPLWEDKIRFPRQPKGQTVVSNSGFANSLRPLLTSPFFGNLTTESQVKIISAFWEAVRRVIPDAFMDPTEYTVQKTLGVNPMHHFLATVLEHVRARNMSVVDPNSYEELIKDPLLELNGETASSEHVSGAEFWRTGSDGAAGSFSSGAGQRVLSARLRQYLPPLEVH